MHVIHKAVHSHQNYHIYQYFPDFCRGAYKKEFKDTIDPDGHTTLSSGYFWWLIKSDQGTDYIVKIDLLP